MGMGPLLIHLNSDDHASTQPRAVDASAGDPVHLNSSHFNPHENTLNPPATIQDLGPINVSQSGRHVIVKARRTSPGAACAGCSVDKKQCLGPVPCSRCTQNGRPCFNTETYHTLIQSRCDQLASTDKGEIMRAIHDLKNILCIGDAELRISNSKRRKKPVANGVNRYLICVKEYGGLHKLQLLKMFGEPFLSQINDVISKWFADEQMINAIPAFSVEIGFDEQNATEGAIQDLWPYFDPLLQSSSYACAPFGHAQN